MIGHRLRCYPTPVQAQTLRRWIGCQRFIYNAKVIENRYFRRFSKSALSLAGTPIPIDQCYAQFKTDLTPWLSEVPPQLLRNGAALWKQAYNRFHAGLGGRPKIKKRHGRQAVWLTSELFRFEALEGPEGSPTRYALHLGNAAHPLGVLAFKTEGPIQPAASIHLSVEGDRWHVSFSNPTEDTPERPVVVAERLRKLGPEALAEVTLGIDRGVANPVMCSNGQRIGPSPVQLERIAQKARRCRRWQRRLARRHKGGKNHAKARKQLARAHLYATDVRRDLSHKATRALVDNPQYQLYALEDLKVANLTARPKAKPDPERPGHFLPNRARAKAGLNRSILASGWGQFKTHLTNKASRAGKLVVLVEPAYSSQECAPCGHTHPDNRPSQERFVCQACGHEEHADRNASEVIAARGVRFVLEGRVVEKQRKRCALRRTQVGVGEPEPGGLSPRTPGEITSDAGVATRQRGDR